MTTEIVPFDRSPYVRPNNLEYLRSVAQSMPVVNLATNNDALESLVSLADPTAIS